MARASQRVDAFRRGGIVVRISWWLLGSLVVVVACGANAPSNASSDKASGAGDKPAGGSPKADDNQQNGDETDVDCGGAAAPKCVEGKKCLLDGDCADG